MKNLASKIIRVLFIVSSVCIVPISGVELYEIFRPKTAGAPRNNVVGAIFWGTFAVYYLCAWYMGSKKRTINAE